MYFFLSVFDIVKRQNAKLKFSTPLLPVRVSECAGPHGHGSRKLHEGGGHGSAAPGGPAVFGHPAAAAGPAGAGPQGPGVHV